MATVTESDTISGVYLVEPDVNRDPRGLFVETYRREWIPHGREMIQGNRADRAPGCVVGLHYHLHQADYWYVPFGRARFRLAHRDDDHVSRRRLLQRGRRARRRVERSGGRRRLARRRPGAVEP